MTTNTLIQTQSIDHSERSKLRFLWTIPIVAMAIAAVPKLLQLDFMVENSTEVGIDHMMAPIGVIEVVCIAAFLHPKTRRVGFFLCTAFIGGIITVAWTNLTPPIGVAMMILLWAGMYFEDGALFNPRSNEALLTRS